MTLGSRVGSTILTCLSAAASADEGPRPPSEYDEDEADNLASRAEDDAYWEALGSIDELDNLDSSIIDASEARPMDASGMDID